MVRIESDRTLKRRERIVDIGVVVGCPMAQL
jgi:hypothetical protein